MPPRRALVAAVAAAALASAASSAPDYGAASVQATLKQAFTFTLPLNASTDEQALLLTAQGLLNRDAPRLWLYEPIFATYNESTYWFPPNYLAPVKNFTFTALTGGFCDLAAATGLLGVPSPVVAGIALYNASALDASRWLAITSAALQNLLPVSVQQASDPALTPCLGSLPIVVDYSQPFAPPLSWSSNVEAYQWAATHLLPSCNASSLYSAGKSFNDSTEGVYNGHDPAIDIGLDGAVALRMLIFNLSPDTARYPAHAAQFQALVAALRDGNESAVPNLVGWAEPEPAMTLATSKGGGTVLCDAAPNFSFWLRVSSAPPALPYNSDPSIALEADRIYIAWQSNEGDTPKIAAALQAGAWLDPRRGSVPIAWGVNPLLLSLAPGLLEFYAATATANDTWFSGTAGAGYSYPWSMPRAPYVTYITRMAQLVSALTPGWPPYSWEVDVWDNNWPSNVSDYAAVAGSILGAMSMQPEEMAGTNSWLEVPGGPTGMNTTLPLIITNKTLWYPWQSSCPPDPIGAMAQVIAETALSLKAANPSKPAFLLVYGITAPTCGLAFYDYVLGIQERMAAGDPVAGVPPLTIVGAQDLVRLARAAADM